MRYATQDLDALLAEHDFERRVVRRAAGFLALRRFMLLLGRARMRGVRAVAEQLAALTPEVQGASLLFERFSALAEAEETAARAEADGRPLSPTSPLSRSRSDPAGAGAERSRSTPMMRAATHRAKSFVSSGAHRVGRRISSGASRVCSNVHLRTSIHNSTAERGASS